MLVLLVSHRPRDWGTILTGARDVTAMFLANTAARGSFHSSSQVTVLSCFSSVHGPQEASIFIGICRTFSVKVQNSHTVNAWKNCQGMFPDTLVSGTWVKC